MLDRLLNLVQDQVFEEASYDTWYRVRIEREDRNINFYLKEGRDALTPADLKYTHAIEGIVEPPAVSLAYLKAWNEYCFSRTAVAGFFDDVSVGGARPSYTISGRVAGPLCDNAAIALYDGTVLLETKEVNADGTYAFTFLSDQKTYAVGSANLCSPLEPDRQTATIQGADQTDINFTVQADNDNASAETVYAVKGARLIDGNGGQPLDNALIIINGNTIQSVSRAGEAQIPAGAQVIDAAGKTIIPGLHDMHVHILLESNPNFPPFYTPKEPVGVEYQKHLYAYLFCGITSVLDVGSSTSEDVLFSLRKQEQDHCMRAPRIFTTGAGISYPAGYPGGTRVATSPEEAIRVVDDLAKKNPDMVKILYENNLYGRRWPTFDTATITALIDESRKLGLKTTVHVTQPDLAWQLAPLQPDAFAHLPMSGGIAAVCPMIMNQIACTPTLKTQYVAGFYLNPDIIDEDIIGQCVDPRLISAYKDPALLEAVKNAPRWMMMLMYYDRQRLDMLKMLFTAGNKIILGTDAGGLTLNFHGTASHEELGMYVTAGLTPLHAITTATKNGAEFLGRLDQQGTIEAGKLADLVILKADPTEDIANTKKIALVMKDGEIMDRGMLSRDITGRLSEEARYIQDRIDLMPAAAFKAGDADKAALSAHLEELYALLRQADDNETGHRNYTPAAQMLSAAVMPLLNGCADNSTADDLITDCAYQQDMYAAARQLAADCVSQGAVLQ